MSRVSIDLAYVQNGMYAMLVNRQMQGSWAV
jgi:hypothetical protein